MYPYDPSIKIINAPETPGVTIEADPRNPATNTRILTPHLFKSLAFFGLGLRSSSVNVPLKQKVTTMIVKIIPNPRARPIHDVFLLPLSLVKFVKWILLYFKKISTEQRVSVRKNQKVIAGI